MTISLILENRDYETITATPDMTVSDVVKLFADKRIGAVPVVEGVEVVGIMSERDLVHCVAREGRDGIDKSVADVMTSPPITVDPDYNILAALGLMTRRRIRHLPVVKDGAMIGFVSIGDLVKYRMDRIEQDAQAMRDYIQTV